MKYTPILILKSQIYLTAYSKVENKENFLPLFELFDLKFLDKIKEMPKIYLNILDMSGGNTMEYLYELFIEAKKIQNNFIPVIDDTYNFDNKKIVFSYFKKMITEFDKIAIKINGLDPLIIPDNIENMLFLIDDMSKITFILDIEQTFNKTENEMFKLFKNSIDYIHETISNDIKNFVISGSLIETSSKNHISIEEAEECFLIQNKLLSVYYKLKDYYPDLELIYSDYTIDEKHKFKDDDINVRQFYPSIKYTKKDGNICIYKSNKINNFDKYKELCKLIVKNPDFIPNHCDGCETIQECSINRKGSPSSWKTKMITHHITTINEI